MKNYGVTSELSSLVVFFVLQRWSKQMISPTDHFIIKEFWLEQKFLFLSKISMLSRWLLHWLWRALRA